MTAREQFFMSNKRQQQRRAEQSNGFVCPMFPAEKYGAVLAACENAFAGMDYGAYMDRGDGLGLDDIAGFDYGYDEALAGILDVIKSAGATIGNIAGSVWNITKSVGSTIGKGVSVIGGGLYSAGGTIIKGITKLPQIAKTAYTYVSTARITYPVRLVVQAGKTVGKWVWNGVKWLFKSPSGAAASAPAGATPPNGAPSQMYINPAQQQPGAAVGGQANVYVNSGPAQEPAYNYGTQQMIQQDPGLIYSGGEMSPGGIIDMGGGAWANISDMSVMNADGTPVTAGESAAGFLKNINPLVYVAVGLAALYLVMPSGRKSYGRMAI